MRDNDQYNALSSQGTGNIPFSDGVIPNVRTPVNNIHHPGVVSILEILRSLDTDELIEAEQHVIAHISGRLMSALEDRRESLMMIEGMLKKRESLFRGNV